MLWSLVTPELGGTTDLNRSIFGIGKLESGIGGSFPVTGKWPWSPLGAICRLLGCCKESDEQVHSCCFAVSLHLDHGKGHAGQNGSHRIRRPIGRRAS